jgi:hypothetical protein
VLGQIVGKFLETSWLAMKLAQDITDDVTICQFSQDIVVVLTHVVDVIGMGFNIS